MSESTKLMSFDEFRAQAGEVLRQQAEFFRDASAADAMLQPNAVPMAGWREWPPDGRQPVLSTSGRSNREKRALVRAKH